LAFWFLNYNSSLQRYEDIVNNCKLNNKYFNSANAEGWTIAHERALTQGQVVFAAKYDRIAKRMWFLIHTPCDVRYHRPGIFG
jgi:hypothetical protein